MTITLTGHGLEALKTFLNHSTIDPDSMAEHLWYDNPDDFAYGVYEIQQAVKAAGYDVAEIMTTLTAQIDQKYLQLQELGLV